MTSFREALKVSLQQLYVRNKRVNDSGPSLSLELREKMVGWSAMESCPIFRNQSSFLLCKVFHPKCWF